MKTTKLRETAAELKAKTTELAKGEVTLTGLDFYLIGAVCLLAGICIGLLTAPFTHGVSLWSNIGNNNGSHNDNGNDCGSKNGDQDSWTEKEGA